MIAKREGGREGRSDRCSNDFCKGQDEKPFNQLHLFGLVKRLGAIFRKISVEPRLG